MSLQQGQPPRILCMRATGSSVKVKGSRDFLLGEMLAALCALGMLRRRNFMKI